MMNLLQLPISQRLLIFRLRQIWIVLHINVKDMAAIRFGGAERGEEKGSLEVFLGGEELDWEVLLGL